MEFTQRWMKFTQLGPLGEQAPAPRRFASRRFLPARISTRQARHLSRRPGRQTATLSALPPPDCAMPPYLKAFLVQLIAWAGVLVLLKAGVLPAGRWPLALAQGVGAAGAAVLLKSAPWWRWIHLGFTPLLVLALQWSIHPNWYLAAFVILVLVFWNSFRSQVPLFLSNAHSAAAVAGLLPRGKPARILDLGSGTGALLRPLARLRPDCRVEGMESAPASYALSWLLCRSQPNISVARGDFWAISWTGYDLVYAFLSPVPMDEVWAKAAAELHPGALLVSNSFPVDGEEPVFVIEVPDRRRTRLYCYLPAGAAPSLAIANPSTTMI
jgi:SAM-dependent methyltransferase